MRFAFLVTFLFSASATDAELAVCDNGVATAQAESAQVTEQICKAVDDALAQFAKCDLPTPVPLTIEAVSSFDAPCVGVFHCGEAKIELLTPDALDAQRQQVGAFSHIPTDRFFASIILHELAHAMFHQAPCLFDTCATSSEYFSYTLQIAALSEKDRAPFEAFRNDGPVAEDGINPMLLFLAPDSFARRAWTHLNQQPDSCAVWHGMLRGENRFDYTLP